jgi:peptidoglycan hydrolase-like protein with peptidoglycan-binding domain
MLPHSWGEWEILTEATDHSAGERQRSCEVCGKTEKETYYPDGTILPGTTGPEVEELQDLLNENGIPAPRDGEYGDSTREAVREVQRQNGLEVDGIAWPQTTDCLRHEFGEWEVLREPTLTKTGLRHRICGKCGYDEKEEFINGLGPGARGDYVRELQKILAALGYYNGRIDGDYGWSVQKAIEQWQREHGMEPTGVADRETLDRIIEDYNDSIRPKRDNEGEPWEMPEDPDAPPEDEDEPDDEPHSAVSPVTKEPEDQPDVKLVLSASSPKDKEKGYEEGEIIWLQAEFSTTVNHKGINVTQHPDYRNIDPEYTGAHTFPYVVTEDDLKYHDVLTFTASSKYRFNDDEDWKPIYSNTLEIPLSGTVTVSIDEISKPEDENGYQPGEKIKCRVTVSNGTKFVIQAVDIDLNIYGGDPSRKYADNTIAYIAAGASDYKDFEYTILDDNDVLVTQGHAEWNNYVGTHNMGDTGTLKFIIIPKTDPTPHTDNDPIHISEPDPDPDHDPESDYIPEPDPDPLPDPDPIPDTEPNPDPRVPYIPPEIESGIQVTKTVISTPGGGRSYYTKDEVIDYLIEVKNTGNTVITEAVITDSINDGPYTEIASIENFYPSSTRQYNYHYTVTEADVSGGFGSVKNTAFAAGTDEYNNGVYGEDTVYSRVGPDDSETQRPYLTKEVVNKPENGSFFVEGEQINFEIIVHNPSDLDVVYAAISDGFNGGPLIMIGSVAAPAHTDSGPVPYCHFVTAEEAKAGKVTNLAIADCDLSDYSFIQIGDKAEAITGVEEPATAPEQYSDCCVRTLTGKGEGIAEYTLDYCHVHAPVAEEVKALLAEAGESADAGTWKKTAELWRSALDAEYDALSAAADALNSAVDEDRSAFYSWLEKYELRLTAQYPDSETAVAMKISETLMNRCADLCYLLYTAPADRVDSLLTGNYTTLEGYPEEKRCVRAVTDGETVSYAEIFCTEHTELDAELTELLLKAESTEEQTDAFVQSKEHWISALSRQASGAMQSADRETAEAILNERNAFGRLLQTEEALYSMFYPERPEIVQELLSYTAREHVIDFCEWSNTTASGEESREQAEKTEPDEAPGEEMESMTWYLQQLVMDGTAYNAPDVGLEMTFTFREDGTAELVMNDEPVFGTWTAEGNQISVLANDIENIFTLEDDMLIAEDRGTTMIFTMSPPEAAYEPAAPRMDAAETDYNGQWEGFLISAYGMTMPFEMAEAEGSLEEMIGIPSGSMTVENGLVTFAGREGTAFEFADGQLILNGEWDWQKQSMTLLEDGVLAYDFSGITVYFRKA